MLFINFLCLLYLMVLIDSHTISKSIDNDEKADDIFDSITDLDHTRNPRFRRDRFIHKHRSEHKNDFARQTEILKVTKPTETTEKTTAKTTVKTTSSLKALSEHTKHHKSAKRRVGSLWRKFRGKNKKAKHNDDKERQRRISKNKEYTSESPSTKDLHNSSPRNKSRRKNRHQFILRKSENSFAKRDLSGNPPTSTTSKERKTPHGSKMRVNISPQLKHPKKTTKNRVQTIPSGRKTTENLSKILATITTELTRLKQVYGLERTIPPSSYSVAPVIVNTDFTKKTTATPDTTSTTRAENDYPGTAQIEELLNDIKLKSLQMIVEQSPAVTDLITSTVTEATFEADPILRHVDLTLPGFYLSTFVSINDIIENSKRTAASMRTIDFNVNNPVIITNTESYRIVARSIKDETITLANKVEDMLQKELKNIYKKVKDRVSNDFRKEVSKAKCTLKDAVTKITSKLTPKNCALTTKVKPCTCPRTKKDNTTSFTSLATAVQRHNRGDTPKKRKYIAKTFKTLKTQETPNPTPTYDDYLMLTLYEQMLSKTHEANVRKMLSSPNPPFIKRRNHLKLSKRNAETLADVKLREDVEKLYDDGGNMPDYDYVESQTTGSTANSSDSNAETTRTNSPTSPNYSHKSPKHISESSKSKSTSHQTQTTESTTESLADVSETSYEGLSNKISYNDYVNGYKHYLKFQKEENNQNFSNLIKYQAHRHHNVDDIGKYILNKIPQLPNRQKRRIHKRFFDDTDIEYQEISTKNDDSWFRKHFYLFIDNGPPKKYYTSQTVPLKSALTEPNLKNFMSETAVKPNPDRQIYFKIGDDEQHSPKLIKNTAEMSLDDLSKVLESYKEKQNLYSGLKPKEKENISAPPSLKYYTGADDIFNIKMYPQSFIGKLFGGKRRQVTKKDTTQYYPEMYMFNEKVPKRYRRNATTIDDADSTVIEDFVTKDVKREDTSPSAEEIKATVTAIKTTNKEPNNKFGFVDVDLVRRQTAVVKLHANSSPKKSKLKDFFKKFHFKKKKDKKHAKRYCEYNNYYTRRRTRFNPLQLMKDIFKVKPGDEYREKDHDITMYRMTMPDYYMVSSHIDSFKPIRYDKPMSIEEMKQQIPNISDSFNYEVTTSRRTKPSQAHMYKLDDNDRNLLYHYNLPLTESSSKDNSPILTKPQPSLTTINETISTTNRPQSNTTSTIINNNMKNMKETYDLNNIKETDLPSNVITVNVKTMSPMERPTPTTELLKLINRTRIMTLDDMHHVLNRLQWKLAKSTKSYHRLSTPYHKRKAKPMPSLQSYTAAYAAYGYHKRPIDELTFKTKLTRIAKFPISQRQNKIYKSDEFPNLDFKDYLSFEEEPMTTDYLDDIRTTNTPEKTKSTMGQRDRNDEPNKTDNNGKSRYTDYFNDLLMWHHDILNLDKVPNPLWKNILKNIQVEGDTYTTPNMNNLMSEVNEMNLYLDDGSIFDQLKMSSPKMVTAKSASSIRREPIVNQQIKNQGSMNQGSMNQGSMNQGIMNQGIMNQGRMKQGSMNQGSMNQGSMNQGIVRSFAMHDNAIVTNKDMIIQGEAKYYQYNKQKDINAAPLSEFTLLNKNNDKNINKKVQKLKKKMKPKAKEKVTRRSSLSTFKEDPAILVDTTLLSYDDAVDSINTNIEVKKLSRNSQKSTKAAQRKTPIKHHPILKTNKAPVQYFTTPLPMKSRDFDRFLKEHQMDVESVTSPMVELPNFVNSVQPNKPVLKLSTSAVHQKPLKYPTFKHTPNLAMAPNYNKPMNLTKVSRHAVNLNRIKNKSKETSDDFDRPKRFSELNKNLKPFFSKTTQEFNYYNLIKNKMKMFEKKATAVQKQSTEVFTLDPRNKEVEITIINFDDIDKITTNIGKSFEAFSLPLLQKYGSTNISDYSELPVTTTESYFNSQKEDSMHNELLYKDIFSERTTDRDTKETDFIPLDFKHTDPIEYFNVTSDSTPLPSSSTMPRLPYPLDFLKIPHVSCDKNPNGKEYSVPKRIHISSHHYKYDIFYNDDKKHSKPCNEDTGRPKLSINTATPGWMMRQMKLTNYKTPTIFRKGESNTEMIKKIDKTAKRNRQARHASKSKATQKLIHKAHTAKRSTTIINQINKNPTSTEYRARNSSEKREAVPVSTTEFHTTAQPGSLNYDIKKLNRSKTVQSKKWDHRKRLYKISALIGERLKFMMRNSSNSSSTTKKLVATKQERNMNRRNCSCSKTSTTAEAVFKEELGEEVEGLQIKYKPEYHTEKTSSLIPIIVDSARHITTTTTPMMTSTPQETTTQPPARKTQQSDHDRPFKCKGHEFPHDLPNDFVYIKPDTYDDQCYYETGPLEKPPEKTSTLQDPDHAEKHYEKKRDVQNSFTAKDVAALEVIVDLMKNTLSYEEKEIASVFNTDSNIAQTQQPTQSIPHNESTNSIQVHIAIPFDFQTGRKRSPLGPVRVRKVFSAKMYTPVDLEYQVHSYEGDFPITYPAPGSSNATQTSSPTTVAIASSETKANSPSLINRLPVSISQVGHVSHVNFFTNLSKISKNPFGAQVEGLSPGMYLLVDKPNNGYALKPVKGKINLSDLKTRQVDTFTPTISMATSELTNLTEIETSSLRSLGKNTLSKEFIAAVNNHLIELYENMSHADKDVRKTRSLWEQEEVDVEKYDENKLFKRRIDWDAVKQYFGNDRVCNCKCKPYKTMCRACAASDAVIDELIFEFDNLGRYMQDHCTEIQTFFWMNPNGGQKLRESVNRIDKSLTDYYNRAKGKCQGKTCKTFTTYNKRHITRNDKIKAKKNNTMFNLLSELTNLADDLNKTVSLQACFNAKLKKEGEKFLNAINSCLLKKTVTKRSMEASPTKRKLIKNVYSLDNVNVNIICKPESPTTQAEIFDPTTSVPLHSESNKSSINDHLFDYDLDLKHKKRKGLKKLLPRKSNKHKLFSYYVLDDNKKPKIIYKRSAVDYIATPLISDGGGAFWYDYIKGNTFEPRLVRESSQETSPNFEIAVVQKGPDGQSKVQKLPEAKKKPHVKPFITSRTSSMRAIENTKVTEVPTDYLINNINQLLQLFGSLQDIESMNMHANRSTMFLPTTKEQITSSVRNLKKSNKYVNKLITKINYNSSPPKSKQTLVTTTPFPKSRSPTECTPPSAPPPPPPKCPPPPPTCPPPPPPKCPSSLLQCPPSPPPKCPPPPPPPPDCPPPPPTCPPPAPANCTCGEPPPPPGSCKCPEPPPPCGNQTCEIRKADVCIKETTALKSTTKAAAIETEVWEGKDSNLYGKLKTATLKFLDSLGKGYPYDADTTPQMPVGDHLLYSHGFEKFSDKDVTSNLINLEDSSQITTNMSPTIVIIDEYGQSNNEVSIEPTENADSYKSLLLSIIQFETNRLHDEWHRLAYGNENEDGDYKRSVMEYAKADKSIRKTTKSDKDSKKNTDQEYDVLQGLKGWNWKDIGNLEIPDPNPDKGETKCNGLLNKLVSKMGIKVVCGKKKAAKKTREVTNKLRLNKKRFGKLKSRKPVKPTDYSMEEACDTRRTSKSSQICDIKATFDHVLNLQNILSPNDFENFVKNISCYQFRSLDKNFFIPYQRKGTRWDWIRNKRSLKIHFSRIKDGSEFDDEYDVVNFNDDNDFFEKFVKGDDGIYKIIKRTKRTVSLRAVDHGLRNIPPLKPPENEIYVMAGDAINLNCYPNVESDHPYDSAKYTWRTDRVNMLKMDNVQVCGMNITINNVSPKNVGTYTCSGGGKVKRKVRLSVMNIPTFDVIFRPVYKTSSSCSYDDLKAIQSLGPLMAEKTGCTKSCSMRIDEPVCQVDRATNMSLVSAAVVVSLTQQPVPCSVQCRRDIFSSLVMLSAANAPVLASTGVVISKDGVNETLYPCMNIMRPVVTHALKKKDSNGHREYHGLMSKLTPGTVDVVLVCPAGYYLISEQKICSTCPADTSSVSGDNTCSPCPHGTRAPPGADTCSALGDKPRRYDWWWYPSCGYLAAFSCVFISCGLCVCLAMCVHIATQEPSHGEEASYEVEENRCAMDRPTYTTATAHTPCTRPLSPSRVILARFFKPSLTSSRATDSQETKFELWKERNIPPPVPPIDFDI